MTAADASSVITIKKRSSSFRRASAVNHRRFHVCLVLVATITGMSLLSLHPSPLKELTPQVSGVWSDADMYHRLTTTSATTTTHKSNGDVGNKRLRESSSGREDVFDELMPLASVDDDDVSPTPSNNKKANLQHIMRGRQKLSVQVVDQSRNPSFAQPPHWTQHTYDPSLTKQLVQSQNLGTLPPHPQAINLKGAHHAILVPYRDRPFHLQEFTTFLPVYLNHWYTNGSFSIWIVEQDDSALFNRAFLGNVGLQHIMKKQPNTTCITIHDVDMIPRWDSQSHYHDCATPLQLASHQHSVQYYCGGVTVLHRKHWQVINGLSNDYQGWGGEDDDLCERLRMNDLLSNVTNDQGHRLPRRPSPAAVFQLISQSKEHHLQRKNHDHYNNNVQLMKAMQHGSDHWKRDGLNDLVYNMTRRPATKTVSPQHDAGIKIEVTHLHVVPGWLPDTNKQRSRDTLLLLQDKQKPATGSSPKRPGKKAYSAQFFATKK